MKTVKIVLMGFAILVIASVAAANIALNDKSDVDGLSGVTLENLEAITQEINVPPGYVICYSTYSQTQVGDEVIFTITKCNGCVEIDVYWATDKSSCRPSGSGMYV